MKLNWNLITKGMRAHLQLKNKLADKIKKLETHLDHFPPDATHLQINLEKNPKRELFVAGLTLHPLSLLFGLHGSAMISKTLRIPKP